MGDMGKLYGSWTNEKKYQKGVALLENTKALENCKYTVVFKNNGFHAIVDGRLDFWTSTSTWICRKTKKKHFGFDNMMKHLEESNND